jgi:hypothetical protein
MSRPSLELGEPGKNVLAAKALQTRLENANLQLVNKVTELNAQRMDDDDEVRIRREEVIKILLLWRWRWQIR